MPPGGERDDEPRSGRRQVLGAIAAGGLTALSATVVATGSLIGSERADEDDEPVPETETAEDPVGHSLSVERGAILGGEGPDAFREIAVGEAGLVLAGVTTDEDLSGEGWLVQIDEETSPGWQETYVSEQNRTKREIEEGYQVYDSLETAVPDGDGGWLLVGWTHDLSPDSKRPWIVKIDVDRESQWERTYERPNVNSFRDVFADGVRVEGGYVLAGVTLGAEFVDIRRGDGWVVQVDDQGEILWEETYNPQERNHAEWTEDVRHDRFTTIVETENGFLLGGTATPEGTSDTVPSVPWLVATDEEGQRKWSTLFETVEPVDAAGHSVVVNHVLPTDENNYLLAGAAGSYEHRREFRSKAITGDGWLALSDGNGGLTWEETISDGALHTALSLDGVEGLSGDDAEYLVAGQRDGHPWTGLIDETGELVTTTSVQDDDGEVTAATMSDGNVLLAGQRMDGDEPSGFVVELDVR